MFDIRFDDDGTIQLQGRLDAAQAGKAGEFLEQVVGSSVVDFACLDYLSSAGIGKLCAAQKRLIGSGEALKLKNLNPHIREVFRIAQLYRIFEIEDWDTDPTVGPML